MSRRSHNHKIQNSNRINEMLDCDAEVLNIVDMELANIKNMGLTASRKTRLDGLRCTVQHSMDIWELLVYF